MGHFSDGGLTLVMMHYVAMGRLIVAAVPPEAAPLVSLLLSLMLSMVLYAFPYYQGAINAYELIPSIRESHQSSHTILADTAPRAQKSANEPDSRRW